MKMDIYSRLIEIETAAQSLSSTVDEKNEVTIADVSDICDMIQDLSQIAIVIATDKGVQ